MGQAVKQALQKGTLVTERRYRRRSNGCWLSDVFRPAPASTQRMPRLPLEKRRIAIETEIELLKGRKGQMPAGQYEEEFERLAIELAKISAQIRSTK